MSTNREYPAGALEVAAQAIYEGPDQYGRPSSVTWDEMLTYGGEFPGNLDHPLANNLRAAAGGVLDALAAMPPEDRAALARWLTEDRDDALLDDEDHSDDGLVDRRGDPDVGDFDFGARAASGLKAMNDERERIEAATIKRVTGWLRNRAGDSDAVGRGMAPAHWLYAARHIDREFGGPDAVK